MPLTPDAGLIRKINTSSFTGDAWAVLATLALPPVTVPRMRLPGVGRTTLTWVVEPRAGEAPGSAYVADVSVDLTVSLAVLSQTQGGVALPVLYEGTAIVNGNLLQHAIIEDDLVGGETFVFAITSFTAGTAPWLWIYPISAVELAPAGVP